jgi:tRNA threonylcarbamoyladenosine biosynthesis protein TsaE
VDLAETGALCRRGDAVIRIVSVADDAVTVASSQLEDTWEFGRAVALALGSSFAIMGLEGELGAGKTAFTRGFVKTLAPEAEVLVASPTYAICHTYRTEPALHHLDLYRVSDEDDLESTGFRDLIERSVMLIEWPSCVPSVLELLHYRVDIEHGRTEDERTLTFSATALGQMTVVANVVRHLRTSQDGVTPSC